MIGTPNAYDRIAGRGIIVTIDSKRWLIEQASEDEFHASDQDPWGRWFHRITEATLDELHHACLAYEADLETT